MAHGDGAQLAQVLAAHPAERRAEILDEQVDQVPRPLRAEARQQCPACEGRVANLSQRPFPDAEPADPATPPMEGSIRPTGTVPGRPTCPEERPHTGVRMTKTEPGSSDSRDTAVLCQQFHSDVGCRFGALRFPGFLGILRDAIVSNNPWRRISLLPDRTRVWPLEHCNKHAGPDIRTWWTFRRTWSPR